MEQLDALVVGAGPAGLMAADQLARAGMRVVVVDAKPSIGRKFLMAGKSGLNLTKDEPLEMFLDAYGEARDWLAPMLHAFGPIEVQAWANALGQEVFTGTSGRVFPKVMKTSPLLRNWLAGMDVEIRTRWRWTGWDGDGLAFETPDGMRAVKPRVTVLTLGGASWARLGSDGKWADLLDGKTTPFRPSNMGFLRGWTKYMEPHFGAPIKPVRLTCGDSSLKGEFVITSRGVEGSAIYAMSGMLRDGGELVLDLLPDISLADVTERLARPKGKNSLTNHMRKVLGLKGAKVALLREMGTLPTEPAALAARVKMLPIPLDEPTPIDEAISTAGGVVREALQDDLMLRDRAGVFCAGEMLNWDAPTGGYLLTACLSTGRWAGIGAAKYAKAGCST